MSSKKRIAGPVWLTQKDSIDEVEELIERNIEANPHFYDSPDIPPAPILRVEPRDKSVALNWGSSIAFTMSYEDK